MQHVPADHANQPNLEPGAHSYLNKPFTQILMEYVQIEGDKACIIQSWELKQ